MVLDLDFTVDVFTGEAAELWMDAFECSSKAMWKCMGQNSPFEREEKSFQGIACKSKYRFYCLQTEVGLCFNLWND